MASYPTNPAMLPVRRPTPAATPDQRSVPPATTVGASGDGSSPAPSGGQRLAPVVPAGPQGYTPVRRYEDGSGLYRAPDGSLVAYDPNTGQFRPASGGTEPTMAAAPPPPPGLTTYAPMGTAPLPSSTAVPAASPPISPTTGMPRSPMSQQVHDWMAGGMVPGTHPLDAARGLPRPGPADAPAVAPLPGMMPPAPGGPVLPSVASPGGGALPPPPPPPRLAGVPMPPRRPLPGVPPRMPMPPRRPVS